MKSYYQHIKFDDGEPSYIDTRKLPGEVQEACQRVAELDAIRREYECTINAYEDLYNRYRDEFGLHKIYKYVPMWLGELQQNLKRRTNYCFQLGQC